MTTVSDVFKALCELAPLSLAHPFDNPGFLAGWKDGEVTKILVALDILPEVICEAAEWGASLIVAHHPVIFQPVRKVTDEDYLGFRLLKLIQSGISAICMHTNLDAARGGVNDCLVKAVGLTDAIPLYEPSADRPEACIPRKGFWTGNPDFAAFAKEVRGRLKTDGVKALDTGKSVRHVAVGGGSCAEYLGMAAALGCDTLVTSEIKHSQYREAEYLGINLIDAGHFATENVVTEPLTVFLKAAFPGVGIMMTKTERDPVRYL